MPSAVATDSHLTGSYNELEYTIERSWRDGRPSEEVYRAGNSPWESQGYLAAPRGVGQEQMRDWCVQTGNELAQELGIPFLGAEYEEPAADAE